MKEWYPPDSNPPTPSHTLAPLSNERPSSQISQPHAAFYIDSNRSDGGYRQNSPPCISSMLALPRETSQVQCRKTQLLPLHLRRRPVQLHAVKAWFPVPEKAERSYFGINQGSQSARCRPSASTPQSQLLQQWGLR